MLQHRNYGAERYLRLLAGWELEGFVLSGRDVVKKKHNETKLMTLTRMVHCSYRKFEGQPLLILRRIENIDFDNVMTEGEWSHEKQQQIEREYNEMKAGVKNIPCV